MKFSLKVVKTVDWVRTEPTGVRPDLSGAFGGVDCEFWCWEQDLDEIGFCIGGMHAWRIPAWRIPHRRFPQGNRPWKETAQEGNRQSEQTAIAEAEFV